MSLLHQVEQVARSAGQAIMDIYSREFTVAEKDDRSPLTEADLAAHQVILRGLRSLTPSIPILSEEAVEHFEGPNAVGQYWLVDPLDGTKEFIKKNGEFTVNIALIEQGEPALGIVYAPSLNLMYSAAAGVGSFKADPTGERAPIKVARHAAGAPWRVVGSRSHGGDSLDEWLENLGDHELVKMGSSLKFCLVADGQADIYPRLGPTSLWDTAAAQCVVEQAGGEVVQLNGMRLGYGDPQIVLNPHFIVRTKVVDPIAEEAL